MSIIWSTWALKYQISWRCLWFVSTCTCMMVIKTIGTQIFLIFCYCCYCYSGPHLYDRNPNNGDTNKDEDKDPTHYQQLSLTWPAIITIITITTMIKTTITTRTRTKIRPSIDSSVSVIILHKWHIYFIKGNNVII